MPTEVVLTGVVCRLDQDADPEVMLCTWRGSEVVSGDLFTLDSSEGLDEEPGSGIAEALADNDFELP